MVRKFRAIVLSKVEPTDHEVLWYKDGAVLFWSDDEWLSFLKGKYDVIAEEAFNISKSNEIRLTEAESIIDTHELYLNILDNKKASYINVHAEFPDYFGEPGLIGNNIRNVAYILSLLGEKYLIPGLVIKFFAGPGWQVWHYNGGGMTDEANWTQLEEMTAEQIDSIKSSLAEQNEKITANAAAIENHEQYLEMVDSRCASYINVHAEFPDDFGEPGLIGNNIRNVAYVLSHKGERYQVAGLVVKFFGMGSWEIWRYDGGGLTDETHWTQLSEEEMSNSGTELRGDIDKNTDAIATLKEQQAAYEREQQSQAVRLTELQSGKQDTLVSSEDILVDANVLRIADLAKKKVFIDMWNAACTINGKRWGWYDETADDFLIYPDFRNGEGLHLTYEQAVKCYVVSKKSTAPATSDMYFGVADADLLALLPTRLARNPTASQLLMYAPTVRAVALIPQSPYIDFQDYSNAFNGANSIEEIYCDIRYNRGTAGQAQTTMFTGCTALREVTISIAKVNLSVKDSPLLSLASFQYMLTRTNNNTAITITVHPDCYAKMTGDTSNAAAAALTEEEAAQWQQLLTDAVAKNITFATI